MKLRFISILLVINYFLSTPLIAQDSSKTLDGFLGIKFGSSYSYAKKVLSSKEGAKLDIKNSKNNKLIFDNLKFGGRQTSFIKLEFFQDKFYGAAVYYSSRLESQVEDLYSSIKSDLNSKYYSTDVDYRNFKSPYFDGDGYETQAIKLGKATIMSAWEFPQSDGNKNSIFLRITEDLSIRLTYYCGKIAEQAEAVEKNKNATDY